MKRSPICLRTPLHLTMRLREKLPSLRKKSLLKEFKQCVRRAREHGLYVIHFSIQTNHVHLFAEARNERLLASGMRSLAGGFAKYVRKAIYIQGKGSKRGSIFNGRYHRHILKTPTEVKMALKYVLLNSSKHQNVIEHLDTYSSAAIFGQWRKLLGSHHAFLTRHGTLLFGAITAGSDLAEILSPPRSWLALKGWHKARATKPLTLDSYKGR